MHQPVTSGAKHAVHTCISLWCMQRPVTSWGKACSTNMHQPVVHASACDITSRSHGWCTYCMESKVSSFSWIYLYSSYFGHYCTCLGLLGQYNIHRMTLSVLCHPRWPRQVKSLSLLQTFSSTNFANLHEY